MEINPTEFCKLIYNYFNYYITFFVSLCFWKCLKQFTYCIPFSNKLYALWDLELKIKKKSLAFYSDRLSNSWSIYCQLTN